MRSAPCCLSAMPRASAKRCTDASRLRRSSSASGTRAISEPSAVSVPARAASPGLPRSLRALATARGPPGRAAPRAEAAGRPRHQILSRAKRPHSRFGLATSSCTDDISILITMQEKSSASDLVAEILSYPGDVPRKLSKPRPRQGARLAALRRAAGLTQAELADLVGDVQPNIAYWEASEKPPRSDILAKLLGVSVEDLLSADLLPEPKRGPVGRMQKVFADVSRLPRRQQDKVVEFVEAFVSQY